VSEGLLTAPVKPAYWSHPPYKVTIGDEVAGIAEQANFAPFPEQRKLLDVAFGLDERGKSAAFEVACIACRQNIKTGFLKQCGLGWLFLKRDLDVVWSAHEWDAVNEAVADFDEMIGGSDYLRRRIRKFNTAERDSEVISRTGTRILFKTRTPGAGRALTGDKTVLDEFYAAKPAHLGALVPTMAARSMKGDPQLFYGSSGARPESDVLRALVKRGRAGTSKSLLYCEFCAPPPAIACDLGADCRHELDTPGCGCDKPEMVRQANPAVGFLIDLAYILDKERPSMPPAEYGRERMGWHDPGEQDDEVLPLAEWAAGADPDSEPRGRVALAVVFTARQDAAVVGLCGRRADGRLHVEVANYQAGTSWPRRWLASRYQTENDHYPPVATAIDQYAFEKTLIGKLESDGIDVMPLDGGDVSAAYGEFVEALSRLEIVHRSQDELTTALFGATTRDIGDAGRAWGRRKSRDPKTGRGAVEIAPIVAVTNAMYAFLQNEPEDEYDEPGVWVI
jgi:hypothetical protein